MFGDKSAGKRGLQGVMVLLDSGEWQGGELERVLEE